MFKVDAILWFCPTVPWQVIYTHGSCSYIILNGYMTPGECAPPPQKKKNMKDFNCSNFIVQSFKTNSGINQ